MACAEGGLHRPHVNIIKLFDQLTKRPSNGQYRLLDSVLTAGPWPPFCQIALMRRFLRAWPARRRTMYQCFIYSPKMTSKCCMNVL